MAEIVCNLRTTFGNLPKNSGCPKWGLAFVTAAMMLLIGRPSCFAQNAIPDNLRYGLDVPPDVEQITAKALKFLAESQEESGTWAGGYDSHAGGRDNCGLAGLATMAMLATGEDPNSGPYAANIRAALRYLVTTQNPKTGFLPNTMYNHGFAMLALAEAYGTVDDELLWTGDDGKDVPAENRRTLGQALRLAVDLAVKSQDQNASRAWRYGPTSQDADTSVTGAVLVGLLAARNAGIAVPDAAINDALTYMKQLTSRRNGATQYTATFGALTDAPNLSAITALVLAVSQNKDADRYLSTKTRITKYLEHQDQSFPFYNRYYMAQALFQSDYEAWMRWNKITVRRLRKIQQTDGSFESSQGKAYGTAMSCLALALNYRFLPIYER